MGQTTEGFPISMTVSDEREREKAKVKRRMRGMRDGMGCYSG